MPSPRQERLFAALFRGAGLGLQDPAYFRFVRILTEELLRADKEPGFPVGWPCDLTVEALSAGKGESEARILANERGVLAGMEEAVWFFTNFGARATPHSADGQTLEPGKPILTVEGEPGTLLSLERVGLNLLQRMSGIATTARGLQERVHRKAPETHVVATRKTPWGLLDKRAAHWGGAGSHRLGLGDAILIKSNHLRLFAAQEEAAVPLALRKAWQARARAAFIEVEVTGLPGALAAAKTFRALRRAGGKTSEDSYPCLVMLDNRRPEEACEIVQALRNEGFWDDVLVELSGGISDATLDAYADCGADALSVGALTHSSKALDLRCKLEARVEKNA